MKNVFFIVFVVLFTGAQADPWKNQLWKDKLSVVPELGLNSSRLTQTSTQASFGITGGVGLRIGKRKHLYTGIYYKAVRYEADFDTATTSPPTFRKVKSDYLVVPIMFGLTPIKAPFFEFRLFGGAAAFFNQSGEVNGISSMKLTETTWNLRAGAGIDIWRIECNFSYDFGITKMFETVSDGKCHGYNLTLGFRF